MINSKNRKPTRRAGIRMLSAGGVWAGLELIGSRPLAAAAQRQAKAFALVGDRYHNADYIKVALRRTLVKEAGLFIDFRDEPADLTAERLKGYRMLIIFRDGMLWPDGYALEGGGPGRGESKFISDPPLPQVKEASVPWITPAQGKAIKDFVQNGGAAFFYHNTNYISPDNADFRDVQGAITQGHPPLRPYRVRITNRDHPITRGVNDFTVTDEQHYVTYEKDPKFVLMRNINEDGLTYKNFGTSAEAGWAYEYGKGRMCFLSPGHTIAALWNPEYVKLQHNAVKWLLREN